MDGASVDVDDPEGAVSELPSSPKQRHAPALPSDLDVEQATERVKVLYIVGMNRSGSTILGNLLGELDGFVSVGELHYLWERGFLEDRQCGCGASFEQCEFWSSVRQRVFEQSGHNIDAREILDWQRRAVRIRHTWWLLARRPGRPLDSPLVNYVGVASRLYQSIAEVAEARIVVDASKRPSDAAVLRLAPGVTPYFVHLVRDPRAVAHSWRRRVMQPDRGGPPEMSRRTVANSTLTWLGWNLGAEGVRRVGGTAGSLLVRYEDFVNRPRETVDAITHLVGETPVRSPFKNERTVRLGEHHTVSGNPARFKSGLIELREDDEWVTSQPKRDGLAATILSLPLLTRYHYPIRRRPGSR